jgi:hypothetical protein
MSYVPPHLRNLQPPAPIKKKELDINDSNDFPALGGSSSSKQSSKLNNGSFADQAKQWEEKRLNDEYMKRVEQEKELKKRQLQAKLDLEDRIMRSQIPSFRREVQPVYTYRPQFLEPVYQNEEPEWEDPAQSKRAKQIQRSNRKEQERLSKLNNENHSSEEDEEEELDEMDYAPPEDRWN